MWWNFITYVQGVAGPYSKPTKRGKTNKTYKLAISLFPFGPPVKDKPWIVSSVDAAKFVTLLNMLFRRNGHLWL